MNGPGPRVNGLFVIPGPREARSPESMLPALGLWIPDSSLRDDPE
jgi:hypothetical protein